MVHGRKATLLTAIDFGDSMTNRFRLSPCLTFPVFCSPFLAPVFESPVFPMSTYLYGKYNPQTFPMVLLCISCEHPRCPFVPSVSHRSNMPRYQRLDAVHPSLSPSPTNNSRTPLPPSPNSAIPTLPRPCSCSPSCHGTL